MKPYYHILSLIPAILLLFFSKGISQTSYHVTTSQGLATHQLTVLIKDRQNNMWFGSYNGLHKHEGTSIKVYTKSAKDSNSLSSNEVHPVFEDRQGFIWAGTTGGLDKLDPMTGHITHYKVRNETSHDNNVGWIYSIFQDDRDSIWMFADLGLFVIDYKTGKYRQISLEEKTGRGLPDGSIGYKGAYATDKGLWIVTNCRMAFFDYKTRQFFHRYHNPEHKVIFDIGGDVSADAHSDVCADSKGNIYFIAKNSLLVKYNITTDKVDSFRFAFPANAWTCCYALSADYKGNIWIGFRYGGLLLFNQSTKQFTPIRYTDANSLIASDYVYSLCEDYLHRMWVTTSNGIFIIDYYNSIVQQTYLSNEAAFININYVSGIISADSKGNIYIPYTTGGLFQYNIYSKNRRHFPVADTIAKQYRYMFPEKDKIYISTTNTLLEADTSTHKIVLHPPEQQLYKSLAGTGGRVVWMCKRSDQSAYVKKTNGNIYYYNGTDNLEVLNSIGYARQCCVSKDKKDFYFLSDEGNLVRRNMATLVMDTFFILDKIQRTNFLFSNTRDLADDGKGNVWITSQNGLLKYNIQQDSLSIYTTANGLLHDFTFTLCADSKNRLWVGSMGGVNLYDPNKNAFINVFTETPDKFIDYFGSSLEAADGHIYFLFGGQLVNIDPDGFLRRHLQPRQLTLNAVQVNGIAVNPVTDNLLHLSYEQNRLYFRFNLQEFAEPEKVAYSYRLQGADSNWIDLRNRSEITFNSLQPGSYRLQVKAKDVYGNEVQQNLSVPFTIHPPFWQTGWFKMLCLFLAAALVYWFFRRKQREIERQKEQLETEQAINYISTAIHGQKNVSEMLWSIAKNSVARIGCTDCIIYLAEWNKKVLVQKAAYGPKNPGISEISQRIEIQIADSLIGCIAVSGKGEIINDTSSDKASITESEARLSRMIVPIVYEGNVLGIIDCEAAQQHYFKQQHFVILTSIATICANKIVVLVAEENVQNALIESIEHKRKLAGLELKALRAQMNPHFIFNAMNSIQHFSMQSDFVNANKYLSSFSKLLRRVLQQTENPKITLSSEIDILEPYLAIEALRLGSGFHYSIDVEEDLETDAVFIPPMIVQPFVENALKHGLSAKQGERMLTISFILVSDTQLQCVVEDNGIGREKAHQISLSRQELIPHQSLGMNMVAERLALLSREDTGIDSIHIVDLYDEEGVSKGTRVEIILPIL